MTDWSFHTCADNVEWDDFVSKSEQGSIFTKSMILDVVGDTTVKYFLKKKGRVVAGVPIILVRGEPLFPVPFCYYQGIILDRSINCLNAVRKSHWVADIFTKVFEFLFSEYQSFGLSLHYSLLDVRAFDWIGRNKIDRPNISIAPRYTALVELSAFDTMEQYLTMIRKDRRQDLGRAKREKLEWRSSKSTQNFINLLQHTYDRTGAPLDDLETSIFEKISTVSISKEMGGLILVEEKGGAVSAGQFFLKDENCFHAVAHASSDSGRELGASALTHLGLIHLAKRSGSGCLDFNGANSPTRADYKHSWAAEPAIFFNISTAL